MRITQSVRWIALAALGVLLAMFGSCSRSSHRTETFSDTYQVSFEVAGMPVTVVPPRTAVTVLVTFRSDGRPAPSGVQVEVKTVLGQSLVTRLITNSGGRALLELLPGSALHQEQQLDVSAYDANLAGIPSRLLVLPYNREIFVSSRNWRPGETIRFEITHVVGVPIQDRVLNPEIVIVEAPSEAISFDNQGRGTYVVQLSPGVYHLWGRDTANGALSPIREIEVVSQGTAQDPKVGLELPAQLDSQGNWLSQFPANWDLRIGEAVNLHFTVTAPASPHSGGSVTIQRPGVPDRVIPVAPGATSASWGLPAPVTPGLYLIQGYLDLPVVGGTIRRTSFAPRTVMVGY